MEQKIMEMEIRNNGLVEIDGMKFHEIEGGFGEGKKSMLVKEIASLHNRELKEINRRINDNIKRFKNGIDFIDLKVGALKTLSLEMGYTNQSYANANNVYVLSERGYSKLLKVLEDDFAWEQYEKLVDGYFNMRAKEKKIPSSMELFELQVKILKEQNEKIEKVNNKVVSLEDNMPLFNVDCHELQAIVRKKGIQVLGGYKSNAYDDRSIRAKVYCDIQAQIKREFDVNTYKGIKRKHLDIAKNIVENYRTPSYLVSQINLLNSIAKAN